jgi:urease accessory protein UreE
MKRALKRSMKQPATVPVAVSREDEVLQPGDVVMLPDGGVAAVERIVGADAYVIEWQKQLGRGPWIFPVSDLVRV